MVWLSAKIKNLDRTQNLLLANMPRVQSKLIHHIKNQDDTNWMRKGNQMMQTQDTLYAEIIDKYF